MLLNSPAGSWHQLAAVAHHHLKSDWFVAALADSNSVCPGIRVVPTFVGSHPYLSHNGTWSEEGEWLSFHAHRLPVNVSGCRYMPRASGANPALTKSVAAHIKRIVNLLRVLLARGMWISVYNGVTHSSVASASSKLALLAQRLQSPGPPIHLLLDQVPLTTRRSAMMSLFCGD